MMLIRFLLPLYSCLTGTAVVIPLTHISLLEQPAIATSEARVSAAPSVPIAVRQTSISDELNAMDDLNSNTFILSANDPQEAQARYREYRLQEDLMKCNEEYGIDPTLISDQSSIGDTPLKNVRFTQCQQALVTCAQNALHEHELSSASWPLSDPLERPVLRTNMLERGMVKCLRVAAMDTKKVFTFSGMTEDEFKVHGTVGMCNAHLILCFENVSGLYDDKVAEWDDDHPQ